jgi:5'-deoxynucleotidase YfbR-like HD superfamily hydrolase
MATVTDRLSRQVAFLIECDRLKEIFRQTLNTQSRRRENDAEHSWALCLFAITLAEHSNEPIDVLHVIKMLLIHDIVEIDAGDTFAYDTARMVDQHEREAQAADRLFGMLPGDQAKEFRSLWDEFEAKETAEAKFATSLDRMQPMLLNCLTEGAAWRKHGVTLEMVMARNAHIAHGATPLWEYVTARVEEAVAAGHLAS